MSESQIDDVLYPNSTASCMEVVIMEPWIECTVLVSLALVQGQKSFQTFQIFHLLSL